MANAKEDPDGWTRPRKPDEDTVGYVRQVGELLDRAAGPTPKKRLAETGSLAQREQKRFFFAVRALLVSVCRPLRGACGIIAHQKFGVASARKTPAATIRQRRAPHK